MKDTSVKLNRNIKIKMLRGWMFCVMALISVLLILGQTALAQKEPDVVAQPYKINGKEVKEYLIEKYKLRKEDVNSEIYQTQNGPGGFLHIRGDVTPKSAVTAGEGRHDRVRAIAQAFLAEEAGPLFSISNLSDIREFSISGDGWTHILYYRYVGSLRLEGADIQIHIQPDGKIASVEASLVSVTPGLVEAVNQKTLSEDGIRKIVKDDLIKSAAQLPEVHSALKHIQDMKVEKLAIRMPPYVVWKAKSMWIYTINAFTGEILAKSPPWGFE